MGLTPPHYGLTGCPIKTQKCLKKCGMVPKSAEWWQGIWNINFFCQSLKITSDILRCIRYSALQCHLAAAFYFKINVASFIFSDLSSDAWTFSCLYSKRYIIYGQNSHSQEFQQNNLLKSCIGSLVKPENCNRTASPSDLAHCGGRVILILTKFGILISTWFQIVPFGLRFSKQFLFLMYDPSFCCP